ncbi:MAG: ferrochelatase [Deltaproteobacteria bacterium]|jgi:ferrochelatase|nr:ferrochelatase [Deltaproteobacteria bacterium]
MGKNTAVLLLAYGGPETMEDIEPFLRRLLRRETIPPPMLQRVQEKYRQIGSGSPLPAICRSIRRKLAAALPAGGVELPVYLAFRYSNPGIFAVVEMLTEIGVERVMALSLSPHSSTISTRAYFQALEQAAGGQELEIVPVDDWFRHPGYIDCLVSRIRKAAAANEFALDDPRTAVVFSAHSIPQSYLDRGDTYVEEIQENIRLVMGRLPGTRHYLAYQSQGKAPGPWLEPRVETLLPELNRQSGHENFLLVPVSFAMDHLETLYDLDVEIIPELRRLPGVRAARIAMANDDEDFIAMLAAAVGEKLAAGGGARSTTTHSGRNG